MEEGKDIIKDLFSEKLSGFEGNVRPELWANISSQIGVASGVTTATGFSVLTKTIIGIAVAASVVGLSVILLSDPTPGSKEKQVVNNKVEQKNGDTSNETNILEIQDKTINTNSNNIKEQTVPNIQIDKQEEIESPTVIIPSEKVIPISPTDKKNTIKEPILEEKAEPIIKKNPVVEVKDVPVHVNEVVQRNENNQQTGETFIKDIPNIFTPNFDGINDYFSIESKGLTDFSVVVLDAKSNIVYKSNDPNFIWDGMAMNGEMVLSGSYVYYITARDPNGNLITRHSSLTINR